jgi:peroxiredoxin
MKQLLPFLFSFFVSLTLFGQTMTQITGFAPAYVGKQINLYEIMDYISMRQAKVASATVQDDSTFTFNFYLKETQKLILECNNNRGNIFAQPGGEYKVHFPDRNPHDLYNPAGNYVEIPIFELPKSDVNYKILEFNRWSNEIVAKFYTKNNADNKYFAARLDTFKMAVQTYYLADTLDTYMNYHRKFTLAKLDDLRFTGSRNRYEKFDFYLARTPVYYQNEAYMDYVKSYYDKYLPRIDSKINDAFYLALLKSSPTGIHNALCREYTLQQNYKLRELVMIYMLSQSFYEKDMPQTNILSVLDSLGKKCMFPGNELIAQNVKFRLMELAQGAKAPNFFLPENGSTVSLANFKGKHFYMFFIDPTIDNHLKQLKALAPMYEKYKNDVHFLMVVKQSVMQTDLEIQKLKNDYPWKIIVVPDENSIFENYQVLRMPHYVLLDGFGYVVASPALGPTPNGNYDTIDKTFYMIQKALKDGNGSDR